MMSDVAFAKAPRWIQLLIVTIGFIWEYRPVVMFNGTRFQLQEAEKMRDWLAAENTKMRQKYAPYRELHVLCYWDESNCENGGGI